MSHYLWIARIRAVSAAFDALPYRISNWTTGTRYQSKRANKVWVRYLLHVHCTLPVPISAISAISKPAYLAREKKYYCVAEPEPPGDATFRVEPEPIWLLIGAESWSRLFLRRLRLHLFTNLLFYL